MESVEVSEYPKDGNDDAMDLAEDLNNLQRPGPPEPQGEKVG